MDAYSDGRICTSMLLTTFNTELNDFRIIICLRKFEVTIGRISVCGVIVKLAYIACHDPFKL